MVQHEDILEGQVRDTERAHAQRAGHEKAVTRLSRFGIDTPYRAEIFANTSTDDWSATTAVEWCPALYLDPLRVNELIELTVLGRKRLIGR